MQLSGGLGLFLLGMVVMTEGLRALAGDALNRALFRFTKSPLSGALSGAFATALVQSSSATTVATVGFVSAGLLTFPQALGVMFGANIGTTITGWLVALVGFKLSLGAAMLPLLFLGMLLRLFGSGWVRRAGWALAGFALIFVGIEQMRAGMAPFEGQLSPAVLPADSLGGRLVLVGLGAAITIITQSSSAGVAIALTALNAGAIGFPQAAALVIGMDAGTTSTTALATLGGSPQTKRTGWSHVIYNLLTAVGALAFLPLYVIAADAWFASATVQNPELALVGFHSTFNILGVLLVLPFTRRFGAMMVRLIPDRGPALTRRLDLTLLEDVGAATPALWSTVRELSQRVFELLCRCLREPPGPRSSRELHQELGLAIAETRRYADQIPRAVERRRTRPAPDESRPPERYRVAALHCLDHLDRLLDRCPAERARGHPAPRRASPRIGRPTRGRGTRREFAPRGGGPPRRVRARNATRSRPPSIRAPSLPGRNARASRDPISPRRSDRTPRRRALAPPRGLSRLADRVSFAPGRSGPGREPRLVRAGLCTRKELVIAVAFVV